ncbi:hypothetical protein UlMin_002243 [Ulmus minor]
MYINFIVLNGVLRVLVNLGLDLGKKKLKEMVIGREDLRVLGICGIGGSRKITLAREFIRDELVTKNGLGALVLAVIAWHLFKFVKKRKSIKRREKFFKQNDALLLQQEISSGKTNVDKTKVFSSKELEKATENFNIHRVLGQGGQGTVYKGMLTDGKIVAVKKFKIADQTKVVEFINEVVILSQVNHKNVVKLLGCCLETQVPLLVYEFIPNGTLSQFIHELFPISDEEVGNSFFLFFFLPKIK